VTKMNNFLQLSNKQQPHSTYADVQGDVLGVATPGPMTNLWYR